MDIRTKTLILFAFNFCAVGLLLLVVNADVCQDRDAVARLITLKGAVTINKSKTQLNAPLCLGDVIHTGPDSKAEVQLLHSETIFRLEQQAELLLLRSILSPRLPIISPDL